MSGIFHITIIQRNFRVTMVTFHFIRQLIFSEISGIRLGNSYIYVAPPPKKKKKKICAIDNLL